MSNDNTLAETRADGLRNVFMSLSSNVSTMRELRESRAPKEGRIFDTWFDPGLIAAKDDLTRRMGNEEAVY